MNWKCLKQKILIIMDKIRAIISGGGTGGHIFPAVSIADKLMELNPDNVTLISEDVGPGIPDIDLAMSEGYSTASDDVRMMGFGAGMGLANMARNADHFRIDSKVGEGTKIEMIFDIAK